MREKISSFVKRLFVVLVAFIVVFGCIPAQKVEAKESYNYDITTLKQNTWVTVKETEYDEYSHNYIKDYAYKITVPANGYVKFETDSSKSAINISTNCKKNKYIGDYLLTPILSDAKTYYRILPKGTYYIWRYGANEGEYKLRWSFIKASNSSNSCKAKAKKILSKKKETVVFNYGYEYNRWFKIVLNKKKSITVNLKRLDQYYHYNPFEVYNSKGERINCPELVDNTVYRTTTLPKGTYYIQIGMGEGMNDPWNMRNRIVQFSWK